MKKLTLAAIVAVLVSFLVPSFAVAQTPPPPTCEQQLGTCQGDLKTCKDENDLMKSDPACKAALDNKGKTPVPPPVPYKLLCKEGTTGQDGIHWENGDSDHVGGNHCTCADSPDPVVRVTGDFAGNGRVEVCLADLRARLNKVEGDVAYHTTIIADIKNHQVLDENAIAALGLDVDAIKADLAALKQRVDALEANDHRQDDDINALKKGRVNLYGGAGLRFKLHGRNGFDVGGGVTGDLMVMPSPHVGVFFDASISGVYELNDPEVGAPLIPLEFTVGPMFVVDRFAIGFGPKIEQWNRIPHNAGGLEGNSLGWGLGLGVDFMVQLMPFMALKVDASIEGGHVFGAQNGREFGGTMPQGGAGISLMFGKFDFLK